MDKYKNKTIDDFLSEDIRTLKVFKHFNVPFNSIYFHKNLVELCLERNIDIEELYRALNQVLTSYDQPVHDYNNWELNFLIDYIINTHHRYNKTTLSILVDYADKIESETEINLANEKSISFYCNMLQDLLITHMEKEEKIMFPYINSLDCKYDEKIEKTDFIGLNKSILVMEQEHDEMHKVLQIIDQIIKKHKNQCQLSKNCNSLIYKLKEFKEDLIIHHHIENNILFKKAIFIEKQQYN